MSGVHSQSPSGAINVISANVEGLSANKPSILSELCKIQHCHCLCLQETHGSKDQAWPKIPGMTLVADRPHNKHGSSVFVRGGLKVTEFLYVKRRMLNSLLWSFPVSLYTPCTNHHLNHSNSLHWDKESSLTS